MKKTLINKRWMFFVTMFSFLVLLGIFTLEEEIGISIAIITLGLILILGYALIIPNSYTFSQEGITVRYCFGLKTFLCWKDVKHIEDHYSGGKGFPWWRSYEIAYFKTKIPKKYCGIQLSVLFFKNVVPMKNQGVYIWIDKFR